MPKKKVAPKATTITLDENQVKTLLDALGSSHQCVGNLLEDINLELSEGNAANTGILKLMQQNHKMVRQQMEKALEIITDA